MTHKHTDAEINEVVEEHTAKLIESTHLTERQAKHVAIPYRLFAVHVNECCTCSQFIALCDYGAKLREGYHRVLGWQETDESVPRGAVA